MTHFIRYRSPPRAASSPPPSMDAAHVIATAFGAHEALAPAAAAHGSRPPRDRLAAGRHVRAIRCSRTAPANAGVHCARGTAWHTLSTARLVGVAADSVWRNADVRTIAAELGNPAASRAVGRANATNPICLIVPCHRVIGADGSLTGFAFGEEIKRRLLDMNVRRDRDAISQYRAAVAASASDGSATCDPLAGAAATESARRPRTSAALRVVNRDDESASVSPHP